MSNGGMQNQEHANSSKLNGKDPVWSCKFCGERREKESVKQDDLSPYATPLISPIPSLTSSDSTVSSCSMVSCSSYNYFDMFFSIGINYDSILLTSVFFSFR